MSESELDKIKQLTPVQRLAKLTRSIGLLGLAALALSIPAVWNAVQEEYLSGHPKGAEAVLIRARDTLVDVQTVAEKLNDFFGVVTQTSESLPDPKDRTALTHQAQSFRSLMNGVREEVSAALRDISTYEAGRQRQLSSTSILSTAALATPTAPPIMLSIDELRPTLMVVVFIAISIFFFICIGLFCVTSDSDKLKFADNMIRTIVGFYIGIATGLLGLPGK